MDRQRKPGTSVEIVDPTTPHSPGAAPHAGADPLLSAHTDISSTATVLLDTGLPSILRRSRQRLTTFVLIAMALVAIAALAITHSQPGAAHAQAWARTGLYVTLFAWSSSASRQILHAPRSTRSRWRGWVALAASFAWAAMAVLTHW